MDTKELNERINLLSHFITHEEFKNNYIANINAGIDAACKTSINIVCLARNLGNCLFRNLSIVEDHIAKKFKNYNIFVYENDSTDNTVEELYRYKQTSNRFSFFSENRNVRHLPLSKSKERTENLAYCRNQCVSFVKNQELTDYTIVLDIDFIGLHVDGLFNSFGILTKDNQIHAMAGNSFLYQKHPTQEGYVLTNYDSWAFRHNWWLDYQGEMFWFLHWKPPIGSAPFRINSAFGGACIYRTVDYLKGTYHGNDCEHVEFHKSLHSNIKNFNLFINPSQLILMSTI
jgi:hypothetical protein